MDRELPLQSAYNINYTFTTLLQHVITLSLSLSLGRRHQESCMLCARVFCMRSPDALYKLGME